LYPKPSKTLYTRPVLFLFILSPAVGELLSGSSPPLEFFNPITFLILTSLYGSGAVLVREYARRWGKGWRSILFLGAAYGIIEEGILVRSFFDPGWVDLGVLGTYGRWLGVNWVWAEWLTIYHAIFSITIPILLVELYYPQYRAQPWLSPKQKRLFQTIFIAVTLFGLVGFPYYAPELVIWLPACLVAVYLLTWYASRIPNNTPVQAGLKVSWRKLAPLGFSVPFAFFFLFNSALIPIPAITTLIGILGVLGYERILRGWAHEGFTDLQRLSLAGGALGFFVFFDWILEINGTLGMSAVGVAFFLFILRLRQRIRLRLQAPAQSPSLSGEFSPPQPAFR
jgi:hypothetical protein